MRVDVLAVDGVRNLAPLRLVPRARFNVFVGDNGQGKTNLLEAVYVAATLRSFRTSKLAELVAFASTQARIGARVVRDDTSHLYEIELQHGSRRVRLDGKAVRPLARYFGEFNVVVFTPEDLNLARGTPGERRRFLDRAVFNTRPDYLAAVQDYEKVLKQRGSVLRMAAQGTLAGPRIDELLAVYDRQLVELGSAIVAAREAYVSTIASELARSFEAIAHVAQRVSVRYAATMARTIDEAIAQLRSGRARDLATQATHVGPHRDDLEFLLDDRDAGTFASQGQLRAILLAWKTAELAVLEHQRGDAPILLLDDVSSELDATRNEYLFAHLASRAGQCFITTTHASHVLMHDDRIDYRVENGRILE
jgi:DNA replication and repair protein RecF